MPQTLVFDIETRIDKELVRGVHYPDLDDDALNADEEAYQCYLQNLTAQGRSKPFPAIIFHRPISIAIGLVGDDHSLKEVRSLGMNATPHSSKELAIEFWNYVQAGVRLISYNGRCFDLPVLELTALHYGIPCSRYWKDGTRDRYRGQGGHLDLMDLISNVGATRAPSLHALMLLLGYSGKDCDGSQVQALYESGCYEAIDSYCRLDVIRTYALFLRLELVRGTLSKERYRLAFDGSKPFLDQIRA
jgi:predicted PolB exonuclease-like 3'-5' exonuclease